MLTQKKIKFAQKYFECGNAVEAYKTAYNSQNMKEKSIRDEASKLLKNLDITEYLKKLNAKVDKKAIMSYEERMEYLTGIINGSVLEEVPIMTKENSDVFKTKKCPAKLDTKLKAIDTLNKMDNSYQQNIKIEGTINNPYNGLTEEELRKLADE